MRINIRVIPRSSRNTLEWEQDRPGTLKAHLTAPPVEGAANAALIALLAEQLAIPKRAITIVRGANGRQKVVDIADIDVEDIVKRLSMSHS
jgi:uncharacterized protein (TIGR00251 family)